MLNVEGRMLNDRSAIRRLRYSEFVTLPPEFSLTPNGLL